MSTPRTVLLGKVSLGLLVAVILVFALRSLARKTWGPFPDEEVVNLGPSTRGRPPIALEPDQLYFLADGTPSHMFVRTAKRSELRSFRASPSTLVGSIPAPEAQRVHDFRLVTTRSSVVVAGDLALPSMDGATDYPNKVWRMDKASGTSEELADLPRIGQPLLTSTADTA